MKNFLFSRLKNQGFTLIEIIIVLSIIGVMSTYATPALK